MSTLLLLIIYLAFISLGLPDSLIGASWPVMRQELGAPIGMAGLLSMMVTAGTIVSSLVSGFVVSRFGTGRVTLASCIMTAAALIGFSYAPSIAWLIVCAIPLGLGGGAVDAALNHYVAARYKAHHMSWLHCFWGIGATAGPMIMAAYLSGNASWREGYFAVGSIQFALVIILFVSLPLWGYIAKHHSGGTERQPSGGQEPHDLTAGSKLKNARGVKYALAAFLFYCGVETTVGLWGSSYLVRVHGLPAEEAALWVSIYYAGITIGRFITGFITFKVSNLLLIRTGQIMTFVGGLLLLLPLPPGFALSGLLMIGLGLAPIYPSMLHETPARFGERHAGKIMGYQMAVAYTGTTLLPPFLGVLAGYTTIGIFPLYILFLVAGMLLFSEILNFLIKGRSEEGQT
ncbi:MULTISPECIES: sugar MFS transporter [Paenibacillus]|uniref:MFS transporter n=1 Tax=Paenibacillus campinasensis TaxID=66347 RepID=A0ABW9T5S9_9BACL|nr:MULTISPECIES: MFS transporter [Paenibacillus]MUG68693.1 MFS transporter [Paenibacillus campinasensis]PAK50623.1 MFS transporter [Paenibacillus sp. 7541]